MPIHLIGESGIPFDRSFFNTALESLLGEDALDGAKKLSLFLTDGSTLDLCNIDQLAPQYMIVRGYGAEEDACEASLHLIPYGLIYRVEVAAKPSDDTRVGFSIRAAQPASRATRLRRRKS